MREPRLAPPAGVHCISPQGMLVQCCLWQYNAWPLACLPVAVIAALWTLLLGAQVEVSTWWKGAVGSGASGWCEATWSCQEG